MAYQSGVNRVLNVAGKVTYFPQRPTSLPGIGVEGGQRGQKPVPQKLANGLPVHTAGPHRTSAGGYASRHCDRHGHSSQPSQGTGNKGANAVRPAAIHPPRPHLGRRGTKGDGQPLRQPLHCASTPSSSAAATAVTTATEQPLGALPFHPFYLRNLIPGNQRQAPTEHLNDKRKRCPIETVSGPRPQTVRRAQ